MDTFPSRYAPHLFRPLPDKLTITVFFMLFGGPFVGKVFDDYGPHIPLVAGTFFHVFGLMMTSISKKYYQILLSQAVCSAIGASMVFYPAFTCVRSPSGLSWFVHYSLQSRSLHGSSRNAARPSVLWQRVPLWGASYFQLWSSI